LGIAAASGDSGSWALFYRIYELPVHQSRLRILLQTLCNVRS
jgi:hypothetical protein